MRTLILMRHAQAAASAEGPDRDRPLSEAGRQQAQRVGKTLRDRGIQHVLCSSAQRTRQTLESLQLEAPVDYQDVLYNASAHTIAQQISGVDEEVETLLVVAHAPGIPALATQLSHDADPRQADRIGYWFPAGAFVELWIDTDWVYVEQASARLADVQRFSD